MYTYILYIYIYIYIYIKDLLNGLQSSPKNFCRKNFLISVVHDIHTSAVSLNHKNYNGK